MANIKFKNFATTTLVGTYGTGDTALTVSNVSLFPVVSGGTTWFYAVLTDSLTAPTKREIVKVTSISGSVLTVTRAQDNTTAQTWANGSYIELRVVAKALEDLISETTTDARTSTTDYTTTADSDANGSGSHIRKIGSTTYETLSTTLADFNVPISQPREISVREYGAVGDYVPSTGAGTDDTTAIQNALNAAYTAGGGIVTLENKIYKLGSALTIPVGVVLKGVSPVPMGGYVGGAGAAWVAGGVDPEVGGSGWGANGRKFRNMTSSLWVCFDAGVGDGTATYNVQQSHGTGSGLPNFTTRTGAIVVKGEIKDLNVFQYNFDNNKNASYTDNGTWNSAWNSGYMSGLAISLSADDASVQNCFIGGFQQAILGYGVSRVRIDNVHLDCINGIELSSVYDRAYINRVHEFLFASYSNGNGSLVRRGDFMYIHDTVDWLEVTNCFTYGHKWGYYIANINEASLYNCAADNTTAETAGYYGVYIAANTQDVHISDMRVAARQYGLYMDNGNTNLVSVANSTFLVVDYGYYVNTGNLRTYGGKITMSGANKIGYYNNGSGYVQAYGPYISGETTRFSGNNIYCVGQSNTILVNGAASELNITDTTDNSTLLMYSDAASQFNIETYLPSNSATKHTLYLQKYGGDLRVGSGDLVLDGGNIKFPETDVPSADANTLDDYQELDWTPALAGSGTAGTQTYATAAGKATKIGRQVTASFNIALSAFDAATAGDMRITNLPFTCGSGMTYSATFGYVKDVNLNVAGGYYTVTGILEPGNTYISLYECGDNLSVVALTEADIGAATYIYGSVVYNV